jgi:hypothetical protein
MITKKEVLAAQKAWGNALVKIGSLKSNMVLCEKEAKIQIKKLYAVNEKEILFKPTKAAEIQFRLTLEAAKSYFIGGNEKFPEDNGFALQPWIKVRFENAGFILEENRAIAMGNYYFTDLNGDETKVEYTFGYIKTGKGLKIDLHHSSMPYSI